MLSRAMARLVGLPANVRLNRKTLERDTLSRLKSFVTLTPLVNIISFFSLSVFYLETLCILLPLLVARRVANA